MPHLAIALGIERCAPAATHDEYCISGGAKLALARYVRARLADGASHPRIAAVTASVDRVIVEHDGS